MVQDDGEERGGYVTRGKPLCAVPQTEVEVATGVRREDTGEKVERARNMGIGGGAGWHSLHGGGGGGGGRSGVVGVGVWHGAVVVVQRERERSGGGVKMEVDDVQMAKVVRLSFWSKDWR